MSERSIVAARARLTLIWWVWSATLTLMILFLTVKAGLPAAPTIWSWFLPNILPVLTLVGTATAAATATPVGTTENRRRLAIAYGASVFYLLLLTFSIGMLFFVDISEGFKASGLWLAPFQALASSALAYVFFEKK